MAEEVKDKGFDDSNVNVVNLDQINPKIQEAPMEVCNEVNDCISYCFT